MKKVLVLVLSLFSVQASALILNETTDFNHLAAATNIGTLDEGVNTITGGINGSCIYISSSDNSCLWNGDERDAIQFTIAAGFELTAATLQTTLFDLQGDVIGVLWGRSDSGGLNILRPVGSTPSNMLTGGALTGTLNYEVFFYDNVSTGKLSDSYRVGYEYNLVVSRIEEERPVDVAAPTTLTLLAAGLLLMGRKRKVTSAN